MARVHGQDGEGAHYGPGGRKVRVASTHVLHTNEEAKGGQDAVWNRRLATKVATEDANFGIVKNTAEI